MHCGVTVKWTLQETLSYSSNYPHSKISLWPANTQKSSQYSRKLIQAMYAVALLAALRVGEITYRGNQPGQNIISISQIAFMKTREGTVTALKLTLRNYKHSDFGPSRYFHLPRKTSLSGLSPVRVLVYKYSGTFSGASFLLARCLSNISILLCDSIKGRAASLWLGYFAL